MAKQSAGLLVYRMRSGTLEVFLVHPGGPFWARKDAGAWSIPKGEFEPTELALDAARREFQEEVGRSVSGPFSDLGTIRQAGGKTVQAFAACDDFDAATLHSNAFEMEWPPRSGKRASFPEVDRAAWFPLDAAALKINAAQAEFLARLKAQVGA